MSLFAVAIAASFAVGGALLSVTAAAMFRRGMLVPREVPDARVTLIMAATGTLPDIEALFAALLAQTLTPERLLIAVESQADPAYRRITDLAPHYPTLAIEVVIAELADQRAQKLTNLLAALARLGPSDAFVVTFDADIRPQPWWLAALVGPLARGGADIVSGYRWPVPETLSLATVIVASIDRAVAVLPRFDSAGGLWGGSLAMRRETIERLDMPATLARALTEDLVIADRATALGLRQLIRRGLRVPTPLRGSFADLWRFARRQLQGVRLYRRGYWVAALLAHTGELAARLALIVAVVLGVGASRIVALAALVALGGLGSVAVGLRQSIGRRLEVPDRPSLAAAQYLLVWTIVPALAFYVSAIWASAVHSPVRWAHVQYAVDRRGRVVGATRRAHRASAQR